MDSTRSRSICASDEASTPIVPFFHNPRTLWEASQVSVTFSWTITEARYRSFSGLERGERLSCYGAVLVCGRFGLSSGSRPGESNQDAKIEQDRSPLNPGNLG